MILDSSNNLLGTTQFRGINTWGTLFELTPVSGGWSENTIYNWSGESDGGTPLTGVVFGSGSLSASLFATTSLGGPSNGGTFDWFVPSDGWLLYSGFPFSYSGSGHNPGPAGKVVMDANNNVYGTTYLGGAYGYGAIFRLTPYYDGQWIYSSLHDFTGGSDGGYPISDIVIDSSGNLYGTASVGGNSLTCNGQGCGVVWEITP